MGSLSSPKILVIGAGPAARDLKAVKASQTHFKPDLTFMCRDYYPEFKHELAGRIVVWDSEIDPDVWEIYGPRWAGNDPPELALDYRRAWLPGWADASKIWWHCAGAPDFGHAQGAAVTFKVHNSWSPYLTTGENAYCFACRQADVIGTLGLQAEGPGLERMADDQRAITARVLAEGKQVIDYSGSGAVHDCKGVNHA